MHSLLSGLYIYETGKETQVVMLPQEVSNFLSGHTDSQVSRKVWRAENKYEEGTPECLKTSLKSKYCVA